MRKSKCDIDSVLRRWPYRPGEVQARLVHAADTREVIQMRIEMGLVQMETTDRPDGQRPGGASTYFDHLLGLSLTGDPEFILDEDQCYEVDRELAQFYQRRVCWLSLREFARAVRDADHSLALIDFARAHSPSEEWIVSHTEYRPFILFHRTQAAALSTLQDVGPEAAIDQINAGLTGLDCAPTDSPEEELLCLEDPLAEEEAPADELVSRLLELREMLREHYGVGRTLSERLEDAVACEHYELAAQLRDEISRRGAKMRV
ncbi:MAG: UvrB/UvrC motif-containing protein [Pirellulales bacterium]|nr:UvrB/UvrC motif-containing protein [Planctomycetales bacterium]